MGQLAYSPIIVVTRLTSLPVIQLKIKTSWMVHQSAGLLAYRSELVVYNKYKI